VDDRSNRLYFAENAAGTAHFRYIELGPQPHDSESLRLALQNALNANRPAGPGHLHRDALLLRGRHLDGRHRKCRVSLLYSRASSGSFLVFPRQTLANWSWYENVWLANGGPVYDPRDLRITEVVSFDTPAFQSSHQRRYIDLRGRHTLLIRSDLVNNDAVSVNGLRGVVAKAASSSFSVNF
jgi:hypothetical protein